MVGNKLCIFCCTLWIADYIDTLPAEIHTIWSKKQTGTSFLFIFNRYIFLIQWVPDLVYTLPGPSTDNICNILIKLQKYLGLAALLSTNALFSLRVYAIYGGSRVILAISALFLLSRLSIDILVSISPAP
ncbi:hypothetical protein GYMLUDRAFT_410202 [Collybiopsis luxurians FD-317 M1]|uniref:DUF6533 domain-containing protein n=1 Tax=Collybiopsis luxurians FD-317 M1 TaxID=944289 RepID=A0A0D0C084_9AGAR|nr:hypothetical protein GYMLUDRAFT_410202 [Collybiopsis luxurians FD-317 M1]